MTATAEQLHDCLETVSGLYQSALDDRCLDYLAERGISEDSRYRWRIGFAPNEWSWIPDASSIGPELLCEAGVCGKSERGYFDRFKGRLIFPIQSGGVIVGLAGRKVPWIEAFGGKYINSPETLTFKKSELLYGLDDAIEQSQAVGEVIVVEGQMDVIMAHQHGLTNVVACMGVAFGEWHIQRLRQLCDSIVLLLDGDEAGQKRSRKLAESLIEAGANDCSRIATISGGADPAELVHRGEVRLITEAIEDAMDPMRFILMGVIRTMDRDNVGQQMELLSELHKHVRHIKGPTRRTVMSQVSRVFGLEKRLIEDSFYRFEKSIKR